MGEVQVPWISTGLAIFKRSHLFPNYHFGDLSEKIRRGVPPFLGAKQDLPRGFKIGLFQLGGFVLKGI